MGEFTQRMVVWAHRYQLRRAERWQKYYDLSATKFLTWSTLRRRKAKSEAAADSKSTVSTNSD